MMELTELKNKIIFLWIIGSEDVASNKYYSTGQHRGNHGNEGQLHINQNNIREFDCYVLGHNEDMKKSNPCRSTTK